MNGRLGYGAGLVAAFATLVIGAGWQIATRWGVTTSLHPVDLALLRYGVPGLVLLPIALKHGLLPANVAFPSLAAIVIGGGLPFGLLGIGGSAFAPVAHMGVFVPGSVALAVAVLTIFVLKQPMSVFRRTGLGLLVGGLGLLAVSTFRTLELNMLTGHVMFLSAAALWVAYTLAFKRSGLTPLHGAALIGVWSLILVVPIWLAVPGTRLLSAPVSDVFLQVLWQGLLAGVVAVFAYGVAVREIGAPATTAIGALLPALVAIGGAIILGEPITLGVGIAVALTVAGVFLLTGWLEHSQKPAAVSAVER
jgi:drug/metabolite transporter (DMT)-like permease